jgi:hypothetical protein
MKARLVGITVVAVMMDVHLVSVALSEQLVVIAASSMDEPSTGGSWHQYCYNRTLSPS